MSLLQVFINFLSQHIADTRCETTSDAKIRSYRNLWYDHIDRLRPSPVALQKPWYSAGHCARELPSSLPSTALSTAELFQLKAKLLAQYVQPINNSEYKGFRIDNNKEYACYDGDLLARIVMSKGVSSRAALCMELARCERCTRTS